MKRETGNMFDEFDQHGELHLMFVTTNSYIRTDGALVMGRGAAKVMAHRFPEFPYELGKNIEHLGIYGIRMKIRDQTDLGIFQVKQHFKDKASLALIEASTRDLTDLANGLSEHHRIDMNYPGIGYGGLNYQAVDPIIQNLPDNVHIWTFN